MRVLSFRHLGLVVSLACLPACTALHLGGTPAPLATSLQEIVPHGDRDHFVYVWERMADGHRIGNGVQVEHVSASEKPGEFEIALSENAEATGRVRVRDDGKAIVLLTEDDLVRGIRLTYDPPLPYLEAPVIAGERSVVTTANVSSLNDGEPLGTLHVKQTTTISAVADVHALLGDFHHAVSVRTARSIQGPEGGLDMTMALVLVPGLGEVRSDGTVSGAPSLHRELACAFIGGKPFGNCRHLKETLRAFVGDDDDDEP